MTDQSAPPAPPEQIVVCSTCDNVFRSHAGRQSCPACGGDPDLAIMTLAEEPEPVDSNETADSGVPNPSNDELETPPAPAADEQPGDGSEPTSAPTPEPSPAPADA